LPRDLRDKLVLITGASSGIGRASAKAFVEKGARVLALARDAERLASLVRASGSSAALTPIQADVADAASMERAASRIREEFGCPDVAVANAGVGLDALFSETSDEALRSVFEVNVFGLVRTVRPLLRGMIERGSGRVLLVSSIVGKRGLPHYSAYSGSKFALHGMADALRSELIGTGVSVGLVCPSSTETEFQQRAMRVGPEQKRVRPRRHSAEAVGRAIVRMAASDRRELVIGVEAKLMVLGNVLAPRLVDWLLARALTRK
jgi:short-subunit dehydrogenase